MSAIPTNILTLLQDQYRHEITNHLRYTAFASWARFRGFEGAGDFFEKEAAGELGHAKLVRDFIELRNEVLVPAPYELADEGDPKSFDELFLMGMDVEMGTTETLVKIFTEAQRVGDIQTLVFVQPMIGEQSEEENLYQTIIDRMVARGGGGSETSALEAFRNDPAGPHDIDVWLAERAE